MRDESLVELEAAFKAWRQNKRHVREAVPEELRERARRAMEVHGEGPVARVTKLDRQRLNRGRAKESKSPRRTRGAVPTFSRVELAAPAWPNRAFAEIETAAGLTVRLFAQTDETMGLLSSLCVVGGER